MQWQPLIGLSLKIASSDRKPFQHEIRILLDITVELLPERKGAGAGVGRETQRQATQHDCLPTARVAESVL